MHYLKTCLTGEAARVVGNLTASGENFSVAWTLLNSRYENKRFLINAQLDQIANLKPLKTKSANELRAFLTTILEAMGALRALGCTVQHWGPLLLHQLTRLLDPETREAWEVKLGSSNAYPTISQFEEFLDGRARALENLQSHSSLGAHKEPSALSFRKHQPRNAAHATTSQSESNLSCPLCGAAHYIAKCDCYQAKTIKQRKEFVIKHQRCFNCLGAHNINQCRSSKRCLICEKKYHTSLHGTDSGTTAKKVNRPEDSSQTMSTTD